jgi:hypothetical protein
VESGQARPAATKEDLREVLRAMTQGQPTEVRTTKAIGCYIE